MVATKKQSCASCCLSSATDKTSPTKNERRRNAPFFHLCYADLCKLRNIAPNSGVKARAGRNMLDVCGDRLKIDEWAPIIEALRHDRNLHFIAFRSKYPVKSVLEDADTEAKARSITKRPVFLSKFIFQLLLESLAQCLAESTSITCIEFDGLPLTAQYMKIICNGISTNTSLQTISFCNSPIGDEGCKQLCLLVRNMPSVLHLDFSNCDLKTESSFSIAETLKYQSLQRFAESWKQSLRYRELNVESMPGLRRIILNNNVLIGDEGIKTLSEVLKEDFWIRAVDLQNCGISNAGALNILETLDINNTLCIVDVRDNRYIDDSLIHQIMLKLFHNNANKEAHEYNWIVPRSQLTTTPSNLTLRTRPSILIKHNPSVKSVSTVGQQSTNRRCMSQCTIKKDMSSNKKPGTKVIIKLQNNLDSVSQSSTAIKLETTDGLNSRGCFSHLKETVEKLKKPSTSSTPLRKRIESSVQDRENINLKDQNVKNGYCLLKQEAYDTVFETLGRFYVFIEHIKQTNKVFVQDNDYQGSGDHVIQFNDTKKNLKTNNYESIKPKQHNSSMPSKEFSPMVSTSTAGENEFTNKIIAGDCHIQKELCAIGSEEIQGLSESLVKSTNDVTA